MSGEGNRFLRAVLLPLWVLVVLLLMHYLPDLYWDGRRLRRVDLVSDVRTVRKATTQSPEVAVVDTLAIDTTAHDSIPHKPVFQRTNPLRSDTTAIVDYADSADTGMWAFYWALRRLSREGGQPVRIAYFGDSIVEGDILTADLRAMLQARFGGLGVGFVPITSNISAYRPTVTHKFKGWESRNVMTKKGFDATLQGPSGCYFLPTRGATVSVEGVARYAARLDTFHVASMVFMADRPLTLSLIVNESDTLCQDFGGRPGELQQMTAYGRIGQARWTVDRLDSAAVMYGLTLDDTTGLSLDNFALRGNSGMELGSLNAATLERFAAWRPYDLIILHYGLNIAEAERTNYEAYTAAMGGGIDRLREAFPGAALLVVSVSDRDYRNEYGELATMPGIISLVDAQQRMAQRKHVAFWNLFRSMGGEQSMSTLVDSHPPMANTDYTHINFRGGRHIASLLYQALMAAYDEYNAALDEEEAQTTIDETPITDEQ